MRSASAPTVGDLVRERPRRSKVFEKFSISYCSSGKQTLEEACARAGVDVAAVRAELLQCDLNTAHAEDRDWSRASLTELTDHIVTVHHDFLREALPRLERLVERVEKVHGRHRPELAQVKAIFAGTKSELELHMLKEEQVLFPAFRELDRLQVLPRLHCGSVRNPISVMEHEHQTSKAAMARIRELTGGYTPPEGACATWCAMLDGLAELETDLHVHIYKEDELLFPRAAAAEEILRLNSGTPAAQA